VSHSDACSLAPTLGGDHCSTLLYLAPGDPIDLVPSDAPLEVADDRQQMGLDKPLPAVLALAHP
jgi:hypothetical protein